MFLGIRDLVHMIHFCPWTSKSIFKVIPCRTSLQTSIQKRTLLSWQHIVHFRFGLCSKDDMDHDDKHWRILLEKQAINVLKSRKTFQLLLFLFYTFTVKDLDQSFYCFTSTYSIVQISWDSGKINNARNVKSRNHKIFPKRFNLLKINSKISQYILR